MLQERACPWHALPFFRREFACVAWIAYSHPILARVFLKSVLVGGVGFGIDYGVLRLLVTGWGWHGASARIPSFALAVCVTWIPNRAFTFGSSNRWIGESYRYLVTQSIGSAINLMVFSGIVMVFGAGALFIPRAVGALAGLVTDFLMPKYVLFSERPKM